MELDKQQLGHDRHGRLDQSDQKLGNSDACDLAGTIKQALADNRRGHATVQIDSFITGGASKGHPWGAYQQACREFVSRYESLGESHFERESKELELEEAEEQQASRGQSLIDAKRLGLKTRKLRHEIARIRRQAADAEREALRFLGQIRAIREALRLPETITDEHRDQLDRDFWTHKLKATVAIDVLRDGRPSVSLLELVPMLPESMKQEVKAAVQDTGSTVEWFLAQSFDITPAAIPATLSLYDEARKLLPDK